MWIFYEIFEKYRIPEKFRLIRNMLKFRKTACAIVFSLVLPGLVSASPMNLPPAQQVAFTELLLKTPKSETGKYNILSNSQAAFYKLIFSLQEDGRWKEADRLIAKLEDTSLMGHVLYQRYMHPTDYRSSFSELKKWMDNYADHAGAENIYRLALARKPVDYKGVLKNPDTGRGVYGVVNALSMNGKTPSPSADKKTINKTEYRNVSKQLENNIKRLKSNAAYNNLQSTHTKNNLPESEYDRFAGEVAELLMHHGEHEKALDLAMKAAERSGEKAALAAWVAGILLWQNEDYESAAKFFAIAGGSPYAKGWTASAGAFWAARAKMRTGDFREVGKWLEKAAYYQRTFYGLIATRALGRPVSINWNVPVYGEDEHAILSAQPSGRRALALYQAGQRNMAEDELSHIHPGNNENLKEALISFAHKAKMSALSMRLGSAFVNTEGQLYETALYPLMAWKPQSGYKTDKALLHAFTRQESRFDPNAESYIGATGLMQVMPRTASYIMNDRDFVTHIGKRRLQDPTVNLEIGQRYIDYLLDNRYVESDLFSLAVAYNAGPTNLARWKKRMKDITDPLLFIEMIPVSETRTFIERTMSNYWIYRQRMGQPTPTLDMVAAGEWPRYIPLDQPETFDIAEAQ